MRCERLGDELAAAADGEVQLGPRARHHVDRCLTCQVSLVRHRKIIRSMREMRAEFHRPVPELLGDLLSHLNDDEVHRNRPGRTGRRVVYIGGLAAATAAGASALVLATRGRRAI